MYDYLEPLLEGNPSLFPKIKNIIENIEDIIDSSNNTLNIKEEDEISYIEYKIIETLSYRDEEEAISIPDAKNDIIIYLKTWMVEFLHYLGMLETFELEDVKYTETISFQNLLDIYNGIIELIRTADLSDVSDTEELYTELSKLSNMDNLYMFFNIETMKLKELNTQYKESNATINTVIPNTELRNNIISKIDIIKQLNNLFITHKIFLDLVEVDYDISKLGTSADIINKYIDDEEVIDEANNIIPIIFLLCDNYKECKEYIYGLGDIGNFNIETMLMILDSLYIMLKEDKYED